MPRSLRFLYCLLILLLALPSMRAQACGPAMSHDGGRTMAMMHEDGHHGRHDAPAPASDQLRHDCLGCIAPINLDAYRTTERLSFTVERSGRSDHAALAAGPGSPPEPPPPRHPV